MKKFLANIFSAFVPWQANGDQNHSEVSSPRTSDYVPFEPSNFKLNLAPSCTNLFLNARDTSNTGDLLSTPFEYFTFPGQSSTADFWSSVNAGEDSFDNIIVGGGVFERNYVRMSAYYERLRPKKNLILWGVGTDTPTGPPMSKDFVDRCALIGTRDFGAASLDGERVIFCPCASAMNRAFDIPRPKPAHKTVCYLHYNKAFTRVHLFEGYPVMHNYSNFTDILNFLGSGEVVVTDSYHGLYWATLLGKKVVCLIEGGKFGHFKWTPCYSRIENYTAAIREASEIPSYPEALFECRELNMAFYQKVLSLVVQ